MGRILDDRGHRMTPSYAVKKGLRYRYYVSRVLAQGRAEDAGSIARVSAMEIDTLVLAALGSGAADPEIGDRDLIEQMLQRVNIYTDRIEIEQQSCEALSIARTPQPVRRWRELITPAGADADGHRRPMKSEDRARILEGIARARIWVQELAAGRIADTDQLAIRECCDQRSIRRTLSLAFLSPTIVQAIVAGQFPRGIVLRDLAAFPSAWAEQHATIGI